MDHPVSLPIKKVIQETEFVKTFVFEHELGSKPGQFIMLWIPGIDAKPFSVAYDNGKEFWVTFFQIGPATKELFKFKEGDLVGIMGPYGTHYQYDQGEHLALVAGGYGAAPMFFVAQEAAKKDCQIEFILGARSQEHLIYLDHIKTLPHTTIHIATDDGSAGHKGYNTELLEKVLIPNSESRTSDDPPASQRATPITNVFTCGPELMMKRVSEICHQTNTPAQLSLERYMKCGFGICGNCVVDDLGIRLCKEGVVVKNETALKIKDFGKYHRDSLGRKHYL